MKWTSRSGSKTVSLPEVLREKLEQMVRHRLDKGLDSMEGSFTCTAYAQLYQLLSETLNKKLV